MPRLKMNYFKGCTTIEEVKERYKKLAFTYHPDAGGTTEQMQDVNLQREVMNAQYDVYVPPLLPEYFTHGKRYQYQFINVIYIGRDSNYYMFQFDKGGQLRISYSNIHLIKQVK